MSRRLRIALVVALTLAATFAVLWHQGVIQSRFRGFFQRQVISRYVAKLQPYLPFKVEQFDVDAEWKDFKRGRLTELRLVLLWNGWRLRLAGPLEITRADDPDEWAAVYWPRATAEPAGRPGQRSSPLPLRLWAQASYALTRLTELGVETSTGSFALPPLGLRLGDLNVHASWRAGKEGGLGAGILARTVEWIDPAAPDRAVNAADLSLTAESPLALDPFRIGPEALLRLSLKSLEALFGETYLDVPLAELPLQFAVHFGESGAEPRSVRAELGRAGRPDLTLDLTTIEFPTAFKAAWRTARIPLSRVASAVTVFSKSLGEAHERGVEIRKGWIRSEGEVPLRAPWGQLAARWRELPLRAGFELAEGEIRYPAASFAARGLSLQVPVSEVLKEARATLRADRFGLRRLRGKIGETAIHLRTSEKKLEIAGGLPFALEDFPLKIGPLAASWGEGPPSAVTSLELAPITPDRVLRAFCVEKTRIPPGTLEARFPRIELTPDSVVPEGSLIARVFGGSVVVNGIALYDVLSDVPEVDFSASWANLRLSRLADWLRFGEMDGLLMGHAEGVVFQSWLPTRYDFRAEARPHNRRDIVFSPEAMKNFIRLFAGDELDERMPGIADWFAFGWPSRVFGGYDVDYAGIAVRSKDGYITLETLDPPAIFAKERKHFILYGSRLKMPLRSRKYPLIVDATAIANFARHMSYQLGNLAAKGDKPEETPDETPCVPPDDF
jgi:hypothetical protein